MRVGIADMNAARFLTAMGLITFAAVAAHAAPRGDIAISGTRVFPESITSTRDGSVFIGSVGDGMVYRAAPGAASATPWLAAGTAGASVLGVLADDRAGLLWTCAPGRNGAASVITAFDLRTKAERGRYGFEGGGGCNDFAVARDGTVYASDFDGGRLMRLTRGDTLFRPWSVGADYAGADGVAVLADGSVLLNGFRNGGLWRIPVQRDGSAGAPVPIVTERPLVRPDGMRAIRDGRAVLLVEGEGRLSEMVIAGDRATLRTLREGITDSAAAVTLVGDTAFVVQAKFGLMRDTTRDPGPFVAIAIPYSPSR